MNRELEKSEVKSKNLRLKVLACAYACSPSRGSEYGVGWGWVESISKYHDLWVITASHSRAEIEAELSRRPDLQARVHFIFIDRKGLLWAENIWPIYLYAHKFQWQKAAYEMGVKLHREISFDIVHQLTYVAFRLPGFLWRLNIPFVWGPIGGLEQTTWALIPALGIRGASQAIARNIFNEWNRRVSWAPKAAFQKAEGGIIAATRGISNEIGRFYGKESTVICEIGAPPITRKDPAPREKEQPLKLLWCGNHHPRKALPFLLDAIALLPPKIDWRLTIIGDGPSRKSWEKLATARRISHLCDWTGSLPRDAALTRMQTAHVFIITSVYDLTSTVLVEALSNGLPVICPDHCGFRDAVTQNCGIKVAATSRRELVYGLRDALVRLNDEEERMRLARGAIKRSLDYGWDQKAQLVSEIYRNRLAHLKDTTIEQDLLSNARGQQQNATRHHARA